jgi:predicted TIM-barrel fold metal-dependent hydrolase
MNLEASTALDIHVHAMISADPSTEDEDTRRRREDFAKHFGGAETQTTAEDAAKYYQDRNMIAVIFPVDNRAGTGDTPVPNEEVAEVAARYPDTLIPFASVDPWGGKTAVKEIHRLVRDFGIKGFKFHPCTQAFFPNEHRFYEIYEAIESYALPTIFHSGQAGMGAGTPGGGGIRLKYSNPIYLDDVAADFPEMPLIIAHPSFPWQDEALAVAVHKKQVYIDLSGWSPKYFPPQLIHYANTLLKDKMLFGSDYPVITPERWIEAYDAAGFRPEVREGILKNNAGRLLGLIK